MIPIERRRDRRIPIMMRVEYSCGPQINAGYSVNLSMGGLCMNVGEEFKVGQPIQMKLALPGQELPVQLKGIVVWSVDAPPSKGGTLPGIGVRFSQLNANTRKMLGDFLERFQKDTGFSLVTGCRLWANEENEGHPDGSDNHN